MRKFFIAACLIVTTSAMAGNAFAYDGYGHNGYRYHPHCWWQHGHRVCSR